MKIIFDLRRVGLGNNGGSSTLIKSGNTLVDMGHDVLFLDSGKNQHTWTKLKADHRNFKSNTSIPSSDAIIATGYKSVATTCSSPGRFGLKMHWIRGWETWQMSERKIINTVLTAPTAKLVNSICLQNKLQSHGVSSTIIRPGYDLTDLYYNNLRTIIKPIRLGGLYTKGKHEDIKRTSWIFKTYEYLKNKDYDVELWMFGNDSKPFQKIDVYMQRPEISRKNWFYNHIDVWLSPAMLEGLHMPPAEAMMTQCPVVTTNAPMSGTQDYMENGVNGIVADNNLISFRNAVEQLCIKNMVRADMGRKAREKIEELGDRKYNMQKLIDYIMSEIS